MHQEKQAPSEDNHSDGDAQRSKDGAMRLFSWRNWLAVAGFLAAAIGGIAVVTERLVSTDKNARALLVSLGAIEATDGVPIVITPGDPRFVVLGTIAGTVRSKYPFVKVKVDAFTLRAKGVDKRVAFIRLGLVHDVDNRGAWRVESWSEKYPVNKDLEGGTTSTIPPFETLIPIDQMGALKNYWLLLEVELAGAKDEIVTVYSHSNRNIFPK